MIRVGVFYPYGGKFDMKYYLEKHMPMVQQKCGPALRSYAVDHGVAGGMPGAPITYSVMCHLTFDSADAFQAAFVPHAPEIMGDISNYSDLQPIVQISEVKV
jgi:uncharacterized protein (TIGR02118 family)